MSDTKLFRLTNIEVLGASLSDTFYVRLVWRTANPRPCPQHGWASPSDCGAHIFECAVWINRVFMQTLIHLWRHDVLFTHAAMVAQLIPLNARVNQSWDTIEAPIVSPPPKRRHKFQRTFHWPRRQL
jgi:hypothetical protein